MTIRKGRRIPRSISVTPRLRSRRGEFIRLLALSGTTGGSEDEAQVWLKLALRLRSSKNTHHSAQRDESYNQQATKCPGSGSKSGGNFTSHKPAMKCGQRGWKRQPVGGLTRLGG